MFCPILRGMVGKKNKHWSEEASSGDVSHGLSPRDKSMNFGAF
jgi:hypothetical protein